MSQFHKDAPTGDIHQIHQWTYGDATSRLAATGFVSSDVGKVALQTDTKTYWILTNHSAITWQQMGEVTASSTTTFTNKTFDAAGTGNSLSNVANANIKAAAAIAVNKLAAQTANRALASDASGFLTPSATTDTQLGFLSTTTSDVQTQLNGKIANTLLTTTGDTIYASGANTPARLGVGSSGQVLKVVGGLPAWSTFSGGINYASSNPDGESDTNGYATYADAAGTAPVDGTGGSPVLTITRTTSGPLRGTGSLLITKGATNRQGDGVSFAFTIDSADKAKIIQVAFDYEIPSGTYVTGDVSMYIVDVTNGTVIQPAGYQVQNISGLPSKHIATFQTASNSTSYRLCWHVASTSASAYTLKFDNLYVGPQVVEYGAPITDEETKTVTGSFTTNSTYTCKRRRVGGQYEYDVTITFAGAPNNPGSCTINLPTGDTIDTTRLSPSTLSDGLTLGRGAVLDSGIATYPLRVAYSSTTAVVVYAQLASGTHLVDESISSTVPITFGASDQINVKFAVPIVGLSSTVQMSNDTDTRVVALSARESAVTSLTSATPTTLANWTTSATSGQVDTHGALNTTTGVYTFQVPGIYDIAGVVGFAASATGVRQAQVVQAGSASNTIPGIQVSAPASGLAYATVSAKLKVIAGDTLVLQGYQTSGGALNSVSGDQGSYLFISRVAGPAAIAASESVVMHADAQLPTGTLAGTFNVTKFGTVSKDSHTRYSTSTGLYTCGISGEYEVEGEVEITHASVSVGNTIGAAIQVNGVTKHGGAQRAASTAVLTYNVPVSGTVTCLAGDTIGLYGLSNGTTPAYSGGFVGSSLSIRRVGN